MTLTLVIIQLSWASSPDDESASRSLTSLATGRRRVIVAVRTVATRIRPSEPGKTSMTRAIGHRVGAVVSWRIRTMSSTLMLGCMFFHFVRFCNCYSDDQQSQNLCVNCCIRRQRCIGVSFSSVIRGSVIRRDNSPIKKWAGVSTRDSEASSERGVRGAN